jgi:Flp pilus assembly protein TadB
MRISPRRRLIGVIGVLTAIFCAPVSIAIRYGNPFAILCTVLVMAAGLLMLIVTVAPRRRDSKQ